MTHDDDQRPNPDQLLTAVKHAESKVGSGRLKVFLGMSAGVGKTYAMLSAAHQLKTAGVDVAVGWVDTHGRRETAALVEGLEVLPPRRVVHRQVELFDMDLDAVLARKPKIVLVDELAHTNARGGRHTKRYLDVLEILDAGIDVYTTVNVQHFESRIDTVREITGVTIHEAVPDSLLDQADEVVLIDLAPEELLRRLKDGRIYPEERVETASRNFFQRGNLTALREMALRLAAERVDKELRHFKVLHGIDGVWKSGSRLMVAVYASPYSEPLIRWTRRLADLTSATWIGVFVETEKRLSESERLLLTKNMALVGQLGGEMITTRDVDAVAGLLRAARQNNVTQIVVGKSHRGFFSNLWRGGSVVNRLIRHSGAIDIYSVAADLPATAHRALPPARSWVLPWNETGWVVATALFTWLVAAFLVPYIGYLAVGIVFLIAVTCAGIWLSRLSVMALALMFGLIHNFFFIPPIGTFQIRKPEDILTLAMYFIAASVAGHLTSRLKRKERLLRDREQRTFLLYNLSRTVAAAQSVEEIVTEGIDYLQKALGQEVAVIFLSRHAPAALAPHPASSYRLGDKELGVAQWVMTNGRIAGRSTDTLPASSGIFLPLVGRDATLGVVGFRMDSQQVLDADQLALIETLVRQLGSGVEREVYHARGRQYQLLEETQKLYKTLLDSVSHELKTPLAAIKGSASALIDPLTNSNQAAVASLAEEIMTGTGRLQRLVENLLDMTRVESGMLRPNQDACDVEDVIGAALRRVESTKGSHPITTSIPGDLPPVRADQVLLVQALANIIHNAFCYTPPGTNIIVGAALSGDHVDLTVRDFGPGLPADNPSIVLEKFFRGAPEKTGGVGLGLSIAKGFVELQGGTLQAANHPDGGALFTVSIPLKEHDGD